MRGTSTVTTYVGEIRPVAFSIVPSGWIQCQGQLLKVGDYTTLFGLLGTKYGGDGVNTFGLPDLRGRVPVGAGATSPLGQFLGSESVTLSLGQLAAHRHDVNTGPMATHTTPSGSYVLGDAVGEGDAASTPRPYGTPQTLQSMASQSIGATGGGGSHENRQPLLAINYIISLYGISPT